MIDILLVVLFILISGFFSGIETAFVCTNQLRLKRHEHSKDREIENLFKRPDHFLTTTLVGNNISIVLVSTFFTSFLLARGVSDTEMVSSLVLTPIVLIFAEMFPKSLGRVFKERFVIKSKSVYKIVDILLTPFTFVIGKITAQVKNKLCEPRRSTWAKDDIKILISTLHSSGEIERSEKEAIDDVFGFSKSSVKDIAKRRQDVVAFDYTETEDVLLARAAKAGYTRYPVYRSRDIVGYINIFDMFYKEFKDWRELIRPITFVGANQKLDEVFSIITRKRESIAFVLRGNRKVGLVTLQDLMREITESIIKEEE